MKIACPNCNATVEAILSSSQIEVICDQCQSRINLIGMLSLDAELSQTRTMNSGPAQAALGQVVSHFEIKKPLGEGGFGCVYEAYDLRLQRNVALKLPRGSGLTPKAAKTFIREAQAAAQLNNPNIVSVFEVGRHENQIYIVSELIKGETLNQWVQSERPNSIRSAKIIATIARALHEAHESGIIHRDIKPRNVIVDSSDHPFITDFGLAKRIDDAERTIARRGRIMGTPAYMSPEQASGYSDEADGRTDIYSLGVMLYEMLVGSRPFQGKSDIIYEEIKSGGALPPAQIANVDKDISSICMKAMSPKPGNRFQTGLEFAEDLERYINGLPTLARPLGWAESALRFVSRKAWLLAGTILLVCLMASLIFGLLRQQTELKNKDLRSVTFRVVPDNANVVIVKVDQKLGRVDYENALAPIYNEQTKRFEADLTSGLYIVEASIPGFGIQEVRRTIADGPTLEGSPPHTRMLTDKSGVIRWSDIVVSKTPRPDNNGLVVHSGMEFERISGGKLDRSKFPLDQGVTQIDDFLVQIGEVTVGEYMAHMTNLPVGMLDHFKKKKVEAKDIPLSAPVVFVRYTHVLEYCERTGTRPILLEEYLMIATNQATTNYPWGDDPLPDWYSNWGVESRFTGKNVLRYPKLGGFYTGLLEWTQGFQLLIDDKTGLPFREQADGGFGGDTRMVVDGPSPLARNFAFDETTIHSPSKPTFLKPSNTYPCVGFRCVKSLIPRLKLPKKEDRK